MRIWRSLVKEAVIERFLHGLAADQRCDTAFGWLKSLSVLVFGETFTHGELVEIENAISATKRKHNAFLKELGLSPLP